MSKNNTKIVKKVDYKSLKDPKFIGFFHEKYNLFIARKEYNDNIFSFVHVDMINCKIKTLSELSQNYCTTSYENGLVTINGHLYKFD